MIWNGLLALRVLLALRLGNATIAVSSILRTTRLSTLTIVLLELAWGDRCMGKREG